LLFGISAQTDCNAAEASQFFPRKQKFSYIDYEDEEEEKRLMESP
jgi:hypothetical protein